MFVSPLMWVCVSARKCVYTLVGLSVWALVCFSVRVYISINKIHFFPTIVKGKMKRKKEEFVLLSIDAHDYLAIRGTTMATTEGLQREQEQESWWCGREILVKSQLFRRWGCTHGAPRDKLCVEYFHTSRGGLLEQGKTGDYCQGS